MVSVRKMPLMDDQDEEREDHENINHNDTIWYQVTNSSVLCVQFRFFNQNTKAFQFFPHEWAKNLNVSRSLRFSFYHEIPYSMSRIYVIMGSCRGNPSEEPAGRELLEPRHPAQGPDGGDDMDTTLDNARGLFPHLIPISHHHPEACLVCGQVWIRNGAGRGKQQE